MSNITPEAGARPALLMASKLMAQHNLSLIQLSQETPVAVK